MTDTDPFRTSGLVRTPPGAHGRGPVALCEENDDKDGPLNRPAPTLRASRESLNAGDGDDIVTREEEGRRSKGFKVERRQGQGFERLPVSIGRDSGGSEGMEDRGALLGRLQELRSGYLNYEASLTRDKRTGLAAIWLEYEKITGDFQIRNIELQTRILDLERTKEEAFEEVRRLNKVIGELREQLGAADEGKSLNATLFYDAKETIEDLRRTNVELEVRVGVLHDRVVRAESLLEEAKDKIHISGKDTSAPPASYAVAAARQVPIQNREVKERGEVLFVHPRADATTDQIKELLREKIRPEEFGIPDATMSAIRKGGVLIRSKYKQGLEKVAGTIEGDERMSSVLRASFPRRFNPRLRLRGVEPRVTEDVLLAIINCKNDMSIQQDDFKIIRQFKNAGRIGYIIEVTPEVACTLLSMGTLYMGWSTCVVEEAILVRACTYCLSYDHSTRTCQQRKRRCLRCGELGHLARECRNAERGQDVCRACQQAVAVGVFTQELVCLCRLCVECPPVRGFGWNSWLELGLEACC
ncbi:uncharacterized protein LOC135376895 [Ornithodoros turicata]|uniref:uncharacterized protein LOC135376895 n=1 Tax=Ornithodoros turicata TaxID=34597 RepID=UPI0031398884